MEFIFLTLPEVEDAIIHWDDDALKSSELRSAAIAAGFSEREIDESPVGVLASDLLLTPDCILKAGAYALIGTNGSTLIEIS